MKKAAKKKAPKIKTLTYFGRTVGDKWDATKKYFNSFKIGAKITRHKFLDFMEDTHGFEIKGNPGVFDVYRNYLTKAGFLQSDGGGVYTILKKIPMDMSRRHVIEVYKSL